MLMYSSLSVPSSFFLEKKTNFQTFQFLSEEGFTLPLSDPLQIPISGFSSYVPLSLSSSSFTFDLRGHDVGETLLVQVIPDHIWHWHISLTLSRSLSLGFHHVSLFLSCSSFTFDLRGQDVGKHYYISHS